MDLSEKLNEIIVGEKMAEMRSLNKSKMTEKRFELQKKLKDANTLLNAKKEELTVTRKEAVQLECVLSGVRAKEQLAKETVKELVIQVVTAEKETENAQIYYWKQINDFIDNSTQYLKKKASVLKKHKIDAETEENRRVQYLQQLKLEGQLEALRAFEKYQRGKIEELTFMKKLLDSNELPDSIILHNK
ncbi:hypothetical protein JTB14_020327 [Gonioctena quinquepunctata]|nr:hypothetical protein JTB14_020327 [Gonioctena quinquepunctata]